MFFLFAEFPVKEHYSVGVYLSLLAISLTLAFLFAYYRDQSKKILEAAVNSRAKSTLSRVDSEIIKKVSLYMNVLFFANILLFAYAINAKYEIFTKISNTQLILSGIAIVGVFLIKYLLHLFLAVIFKTKDFAALYLEDSYLKYKLYGIFLFPFILLVLFSKKYADIALVTGVVAFLLIWLLKSYYGLRLGLISKSFPKAYSFLYICTLEILPLALLCKIFMEPVTSLLGI